MYFSIKSSVDSKVGMEHFKRSTNVEWETEEEGERYRSGIEKKNTDEWMN